MSFSKHDLGKQGELFTEKLYLKHDYKFLARNYRGRGFELDLVFSKNSQLVIVEVKLRRKSKELVICELVPPKKKRALERGALHFLSHTDVDFDTVRFELVLVHGDTYGNTSLKCPHVTRYLL